MGCHDFLQGNLPNPGIDPAPLHCRQILCCLSHEESPPCPLSLGKTSYENAPPLDHFPSLGCSSPLQVSPKSKPLIINQTHLNPCFRLCLYGMQPEIIFQFLSIILKVTMKTFCSGRPSDYKQRRCYLQSLKTASICDPHGRHFQLFYLFFTLPWREGQFYSDWRCAHLHVFVFPGSLQLRLATWLTSS